MNTSMPPLRAAGSGSVKLPDGMTQEEADRLVREADERTKARDKENT